MVELDTGYYTLTNFCARLSGRESIGSYFNIEFFYGDSPWVICLKAHYLGERSDDLLAFLDDLRQDDEVFFKKSDRENASRRFQENIYLKGTDTICRCTIDDIEFQHPYVGMEPNMPLTIYVRISISSE